MFEPEQMEKEFEKNRKSALSKQTQESKFYALRIFREFCAEKYDESIESIVEKLKDYPKSAYQMIADFKERETKRGISTAVTKLRFHYIKVFLKENGIVVDDTTKIKDIFGRIEKHLREPVQHDEIEKILRCCDNHIKAIIMIQATGGLRISEVLQLKAGDFVPGERYQIKIRAETTKTKQERRTFLSKEAEEFVLPFLQGKNKNDLVLSYSRSGVTHHLATAVRKAGVEKKYEHSKHLTITSHSFRAFFITQMGKLEGVFGHVLAGHDHYMKEYDRFTTEELLEKYIEGEENLQIFNRINQKKMRGLEDRLEEQEKTIEVLQKQVLNNMVRVK